MAEYIEREKAIEFLSQPICMSMCLSVDECHHKIAQQRKDRYLIERIPAADVRPVVKAYWVDNHVAFYRGCPECGAFVSANLDEVFLRDFPSAVGKLNFCPNCGADMREES